jgi:uncharacterized membrane protein YgcG
VLYDDRLDGRIDAATYDRRAREIREHQQRARQQASTTQAAALPPATEALDLMAVTSKAAELFLQQPAAEQRRLLHVVLREATRKGGELRMSLREPFQRLRLSNSATHGNNGNFGGDTELFGIWRRGGDSNPR